MAKTYIVPVIYEMFADIEVTADSEKEAIEKALAYKGEPLDNCSFAPDSIRFDGGEIESWENDE